LPRRAVVLVLGLPVTVKNPPLRVGSECEICTSSQSSCYKLRWTLRSWRDSERGRHCWRPSWSAAVLAGVASQLPSSAQRRPSPSVSRSSCGSWAIPEDGWVRRGSRVPGGARRVAVHRRVIPGDLCSGARRLVLPDLERLHEPVRRRAGAGAALPGGGGPEEAQEEAARQERREVERCWEGTLGGESLSLSSLACVLGRVLFPEGSIPLPAPSTRDGAGG